ncbi:hypothetical protein EVAR_27270_1 [Eumeta japonica]|uniref:Uncharacterized protein n=1 Tax=Eumeta variegata TaxID=151549 RepID=A0A4C1VZS4_EUMVA|nr:hypothetical protein EVAR_27270_1 [Eumeta japonica]
MELHIACSKARASAPACVCGTEIISSYANNTSRFDVAKGHGDRRLIEVSALGFRRLRDPDSVRGSVPALMR